jgi:hypothetical protein
MGKKQHWWKSKKLWWYLAEAITIAGVAFPVGILSDHLRQFGNMFISIFASQSSWAEKISPITQYWEDSYRGIIPIIIIFIMFVLAYIFIRGHGGDKTTSELKQITREFKKVNRKLDRIIPDAPMQKKKPK